MPIFASCHVICRVRRLKTLQHAASRALLLTRPRALASQLAALATKTYLTMQSGKRCSRLTGQYRNSPAAKRCVEAVPPLAESVLPLPDGISRRSSGWPACSSIRIEYGPPHSTAGELGKFFDVANPVGPTAGLVCDLLQHPRAVQDRKCEDSNVAFSQ